MLYQTDLTLEQFDKTGLLSEPAVKIHGAVMKALPPEYAAKMHEDCYHPFSVFAVHTPQGYIVRISALNEEARVIPDVMSGLSSLRIFGCNRNAPVRIIGHDNAPAIDAEAMEGHISEYGCRIDFVTPAMFKTSGRASAAPELCSYFQSVLKKYNLFEQASLEYTAVQEAFRQVRYGAYCLQSTTYQLTGRLLPGMTGFCELLFPKEPEQNRLLRKLIAYASYCGIGAKTAQGMGGILVQSIRQPH